MLKAIARATAICGTLDILFAMILTVMFGRQIPDMLRYVASGPFPGATEMGTPGALLGLVVHFALMAIMVAAYMVVARGRPAMLRHPIRWGVIYGLLTYVIMNLVVVHLRFDTPLPPKALSVATQLFAHIVLVGIPTALIASKTFGRQLIR